MSITSQIQPDKIEQIIRECAETYIMPRWKKLHDHEINTKTGPNDLVTAADIETEAALTAYFRKEFPGCAVIGEEAVSREEVDMDALLATPPELMWVIDPVDGTWNFASGSEIFACMVAAVYKGETIMSWIYDVPKGRMATAVKGAGATFNGAETRTSPRFELDELHGYAGRMFAPKHIRQIWEGKEQDVATLGGIRCAGHSYLRLARGLVDFHIYTKIKPWDHLPGALLVREAGGCVYSWDRSPYGLVNTGPGLLIAANEPAWANVHRFFLEPTLEQMNAEN